MIGSRPDRWWRDRPAAIRRLAEQLAAYAAATEQELVVVFDGRPVQALPARPGLRVVFAPAPGPGAADDEIVQLVAERGAVRVATSDRALAERVRALGAEVESARSFRRRLEGA